MFSTFQLVVGMTLSAFVAAAACETMHWFQNRKKADK